ncbi:MAG: glycoside hydrolase family 43 protein, partial [Clostridia bacterium]|nr:glycoside hydrolase family 43 protein [Clostridia bacterium]
IVLTSNMSLKGSAASQYVEPKHSEKIIITTDDGAKDYGATLSLQSGMVYALNGPTEFSDITINTGSGKTVIAARFNPLVMGEGVKTSSANLFILGGYQTPDTSTPASKSSNVTIKSGNYDSVIGFSRDRKSANITYTGTAHISVYGGSIKTIYGASTLYHYSGSCDIKVYGGNVSSIYTGGDATRRLNGKSNIEIYGGTVSALNINNAIGDTTVLLDGGTLNKITESIYQNNSTIAELASAAKRNLTYNSVSYTADQITKMSGSIFDTVNVYGHVYVKQGATGNGKSESTPIGTLDAAIKLVASGGEIEILGDFGLFDFSEPKHDGAVKIISDNGSLNINGTYTLSGPTAFAVPTSGNYVINANGHALRTEDGFTNSGKVTIFGTDIKNRDTSVFIGAGNIKTVYASSEGQNSDKTAVIDISGGKVETVAPCQSGTPLGSISVFVNGGEIDNLVFDNCRGALTLSAQTGRIGKIHVQNVEKHPSSSLTFDASIFEPFKAISSSEEFQKTVYVKDGANGKGLSVNDPATLSDAFDSLASTGGKVIICGPLTVNRETNLRQTNGEIIITSLDGSADYRTAGAHILLGANLYFNGSVTLQDLNITINSDSTTIKFNAYSSTVGENVVITKPSAYTNYPNLIGGKTTSFSGAYTITVKSGTFNELYLGSNTATSKAYSVSPSLIIDGGEFHGAVYTVGTASVAGNVTATVNGGILHAGLYGCGKNADTTFSGDMKYVINGGKIVGKIAPAYESSAMLNGNMYLELNGGEFSSVTDILGPDEFKGRMNPNITVGSDVDIFAKEEGTASYQNPVLAAGDPWVIYRDGYYYFTKTAGSSIGVAKAANLGDLAHAPLVTVFKPASGQMYSKNLWSPELHYFSADDFDSEYFTPDMAGWYLLVACDNGENANHRMYVLKALTDDPQGEYGHPETKQKNVPAKITSDTDETVNSIWTIGQTFAIIRDELYCFWVSEVNEPNHRYQTIHISKMKTPWIATGKTAVICKPTEPWEKKGATYSIGADGKIYPEVVEGIAVVTGPNGEVFMLYCGSGYWTTDYCLGQLKLVGDDPINYDSWEKYPKPILNKNAEMNGTGHCCYTTSPDGSINYIIYHAYMGSSNQGDRYMIAEEYTVTENGVKIGEGTGKPAPLATVFEAAVNPMPIVKKLKGFGTGSEDFMIFEDLTVGIGSAVKPIPSFASGETYDAEKFGDIEFKYKVKGEASEYSYGLPNAENATVYTVVATLRGIDSYSGIKATFTVTVDPSLPAITDPPATDAPSTDEPLAPPAASSGSNLIIIIAIAIIVVGGIAIVLLLTKKKSK